MKPMLARDTFRNIGDTHFKVLETHYWLCATNSPCYKHFPANKHPHVWVVVGQVGDAWNMNAFLLFLACNMNYELDPSKIEYLFHCR